MVNANADIYRGRQGRFELRARLKLEQGQEDRALDLLTTSSYRELCDEQSNSRGSMCTYRTAEDPRVLALKLRHIVPVAASGKALLGSSGVTFRGALEHIKTEEEDKAGVFCELAGAYLTFCSATQVAESQAMRALTDLCMQAGCDSELAAFNESRRTSQ